ncbi:hypothetical protein AC1031_019334 [Aphanomyces cochlioides]|nr:hypothetical protein AC1031_019334 [Aphanomyces cochlioides]
MRVHASAAIAWGLSVATATQVPQLDPNALESHRVVAPDEAQFKALLAEKDVVFAKFYAPWCGHCKALSPTWKELSATFSVLENVQVVHVDCDAHTALCASQNIEGYPTLKIFRGGQFEEYEGPRTLGALTNYLVQRIDAPIHNFGTLSSPPHAINAILVVSVTFVLGLLVSIYLLCFRPTNRVHPPKFYSLPDNSTIKKGHGAVYKVGTFPKPTVSLLEKLEATVKSNGDGAFLGRRPIDSDGKAGPYVWETYAQTYTRIKNLSSGLQAEKMLQPLPDGHRILCIYMRNCPEYLIAMYAAFYAGGLFCALYDTLGASSTAFILTQTQITTVITTSNELKTIIKAKAQSPSLKFVVLADVTVATQADIDACKEVGLKLSTTADIEAVGSKNPLAPIYPKVNDMAFLMYTSGTTGDPKGVEISHSNILACVAGAEDRLKRYKGVQVFSTKGIHLSYLPLPHILEQTVCAVMISHGGRIGFYQGHTLKLAEDLVALRPTHFVTVPRLLNKIYDTIVNSAKASGGIKSWLFDLAMRTKLANLKKGYRSHPFFDWLVFSKIQARLGLDRCNFVLTGSAPLSDDIMSFFRIMLDAFISEGYGQSECTAASNLTDFDDVECGTVGAPMISAEIKLVSVPEMGYEVTDTVHGDKTPIPVNGRGEICYRGPTVFAGYYKAPDKTAEALDADGWLHSGDIGVWTLDGRLKIIDRKKNIFKLSQGEYVAPEKIENIIVASEYIAQSFVYGDSLHAVLVGIIVPEAPALKKLAASLNITATLEELCENPKIIEAVHKDIIAVGKNGLLSGFETVRAIHLHLEHFSAENNLLTPTFKLKRNEAKKLFAKQIDDLYLRAGDLVAGKNVKQG